MVTIGSFPAPFFDDYVYRYFAISNFNETFTGIYHEKAF